jgi:uncharacterized protein (TIGR00369 family)
MHPGENTMSETRSHIVTWDVVAAAPDGRPLSGLEQLRHTIASGLRRSPIAALMDFRFVRVEPELAVLEGIPGEQHYNPAGIVHGGFAATLMDTALWGAVYTTVEAGFLLTTLELKISYTRPLTAASGPVTCEGRVISRGKRIGLSEARLLDVSGRLCAHGTSTLMIIPPAG